MKHWSKLLADGKVKTEPSSAQEISSRIHKARECADQSLVKGLNADTKFKIAYSAAREWCEIVVRAEGLRLQGIPGHHEMLISALVHYLGPESTDLAEHLNRARMLRNNIEYDFTYGITNEDEVKSLLVAIKNLETHVMNWLQSNHPEFLKSDH